MGRGIERVLQRLGLSETTWEGAGVKYEKLVKKGGHKCSDDILKLMLFRTRR